MPFQMEYDVYDSEAYKKNHRIQTNEFDNSI